VEEGLMRSTPTVYEVAALAGVSTATVSRVLSGRNPVLSPTREKVLAAIAELGYVPSGAAKDLAARRTGVLGLCFPDLVGDQDTQGDASFWYDEVIRGMERAARRSGYAVLIAASHSSDDVDLVLGVAGRSDGLVVLARTVPIPMLEHIAKRIPVVLLAAEPGPAEPGPAEPGPAEPGSAEPALAEHGPSGPGEPAPVLDLLSVANESGAYEVTSHLTGFHGYDRLLFVAGPPESPDSSRRFDGFRRAMRDAGLPVPTTPEIYGDFTTDGGRDAAKQILALDRLPRAVVCANDQTAIGVMKALQRADLGVPADIAITGFDGIQLGEHLQPSLTTVVQPMARLGGIAVDLIKERMADQTLPSRAIELPVHLERRASCGCAEPVTGAT
jgi:LacI family transcriptional regulator